MLIDLSDKGISAYNHHEAFHKEMVTATLEGLNEQEEKVLVKALTNLSTYFRRYD